MGTARLRPDTSFAIRGCVLTPDEALEDHHVVVAGAEVLDVLGPAPTGMPVIASDGVILPGLIDLHGHPEYNIFPAWEPPRPCIPIDTSGGAMPSTTPSCASRGRASPAQRMGMERRKSRSCLSRPLRGSRCPHRRLHGHPRGQRQIPRQARVAGSQRGPAVVR